MRSLTILVALWAVPLTMVGGAPSQRPSDSAFQVLARPPEESGSVWAVFVASTGLRFEARILGDRTELFELMPRGRITRNGRTAKMTDLRRGDDLVIYMISPAGRLVSRIEAHSRLPEQTSTAPRW